MSCAPTQQFGDPHHVARLAHQACVIAASGTSLGGASGHASVGVEERLGDAAGVRHRWQATHETREDGLNNHVVDFVIHSIDTRFTPTTCISVETQFSFLMMWDPE
jgi:hypothetical protein